MLKVTWPITALQELCAHVTPASRNLTLPMVEETRCTTYSSGPQLVSGTAWRPLLFKVLQGRALYLDRQAYDPNGSEAC